MLTNYFLFFLIKLRNEWISHIKKNWNRGEDWKGHSTVWGSSLGMNWWQWLAIYGACAIGGTEAAASGCQIHGNKTKT